MLPYGFDILSDWPLLSGALSPSKNLTRFCLTVKVAVGEPEVLEEDISETAGNASDLEDCDRERRLVVVSARESFRNDAAGKRGITFCSHFVAIQIHSRKQIEEDTLIRSTTDTTLHNNKQMHTARRRRHLP